LAIAFTYRDIGVFRIPFITLSMIDSIEPVRSARLGDKDNKNAGCRESCAWENAMHHLPRAGGR
jgi:hypothetical protein